MKRLVFLTLLALTSNLTFGLPRYYPKDFSQQVANGLHDEALKSKLYEILASGHISGPEEDTLVPRCSGQPHCLEHTSLGYTPARKIMFGRIHLQQTSRGYAVRDVYCQTLYDETMFKKSPPGPDQIPDGSIMNTEHSWPQSHFSKNFPTELQKSDLNILFPVNSRANSSRSNLELANVTQTLSSPCSGTRRGYTNDGSQKSYFEPPDEQKGASARAILYFAIRYQMPIGKVEEEALKQWNLKYPVSTFESERNELVYQAQHNRNPFIDDPGLVDHISDF